MSRYGQYCPIARSSEILAERWTPLVIRNLMFGASTFNDIAAGVPTMSRSVLVTRLRELESWGVIERRAKERGGGGTYHLTDAGADLGRVVAAMAAWGETWLEVTSDHHDAGFALWAWVKVQVDRAALPDRRVVVELTFPDEPRTNRRYWLLIADGAMELCGRHPGGDTDLVVVARSQAFVDWHRGELEWGHALRDGAITIDGPRDLRRAFPTWNLRSPALT